MAEAEKTLRVGLLAPVHDLDPRGGRDFVSSTIIEQVFETPFAPPERPEQPAVPVLFGQRLTAEVAGRVLTAPVREGVRFSDGTPLTAEILAHSLSRSSRLASLKEIEAVDDRVVFRFSEAPGRFDHTLTHRYCEVGLEQGGELLGTGPYRLADGSDPGRVRLEVNPEHRQRPEIEAIEFVSYPPDGDGEPTALLDAINAGEVEFSNVLSREQIAQLKGVRKWLEPGSGTAILYFNTERPALADVRVRRALALAVDRAEIARASHHNPVAFTATGLLPPMLGSWRDGVQQDVKRANLLLGQVDDRPERLSLLLIYGPRPYLPNPRAVTDLLSQRFQALGITLDVHQAKTIKDYFSEVSKGSYDLALSGWVADTVDPADFLHALLSPDAVPGPGRRIVIEGNLARWKNDDVKQALARYRKEPSEANKSAVLEPVRQEVPLLPLMYGPTIYVYSQRLSGFKPSPLGIPRFGDLSLG
jgi:ABC-type transport system substrate-binding protein